MKISKIMIAAGMLLCLAGCEKAESTGDIPAVKPFILKRYLGTWHEAARMPHRFERGLERVTAEYYRLPDGSIRVRNQGYRNGRKVQINGVVRQKQPGCGELEVSFFRPVYGSYRILALSADYSAALVTSSTKAYAWILVRDPAQARKVLPEYIELLKQWGFDCSKLEFPRMTETSEH